MSKVSIIVPVYNPKEDYLKECIESILNQTLKNIEIILIDNESTGNNSTILKEYANEDSRIKLIVIEKNQGFSYACNQALKIATGEYIQIVDSDDWIENNTCEKLYKKAQKYNSDLIIFGATQLNMQNEEFEDTPVYSLASIPNKYTRQTFSYKEGYKWLFYTPLQDWNKFVHRDLIFKFDNFMCEKLPYVFPDCVYSAKNYVNAKNIICDKKKYYKYRINISSSVVKGYSKEDCTYLEAPFIVAEEFDKIAKNINDDKKVFGFVHSNIMHILGYYEMVHKNNRKNVYDMMRKYFIQLDKSIYTTRNINKLEKFSRKFIKKCIKYPYWLFNLVNFIYFKETRCNVTRVKIFRITVYKKYFANGFRIKRYFGILKIKNININAYSKYIIDSTLSGVSEILDEKFEEFSIVTK